MEGMEEGKTEHPPGESAPAPAPCRLFRFTFLKQDRSLLQQHFCRIFKTADHRPEAKTPLFFRGIAHEVKIQCRDFIFRQIGIGGHAQAVHHPHHAHGAHFHLPDNLLDGKLFGETP